MFQYPYSHSTYFTRSEDKYTSELPPMNSVEDILQVQFMHDRMMTQEEGDKFVVWNRLSRITKDIKRGFRSSLQLARGSSNSSSKKAKRRMSVVSYKSAKELDIRSLLS